MLLNRFINCRC